tara:strand:- start:3664 stop:3912 length:249 start_codon:yes stop_codon:yes gene_type:complete
MLTPASGPAVALAQATKDTEVALLVEGDTMGMTPSGNTLVPIIRPSIASFFVSMQVKYAEAVVELAEYLFSGSDFDTQLGAK